MFAEHTFGMVFAKIQVGYKPIKEFIVKSIYDGVRRSGVTIFLFIPGTPFYYSSAEPAIRYFFSVMSERYIFSQGSFSPQPISTKATSPARMR